MRRHLKIPSVYQKGPIPLFENSLRQYRQQYANTHEHQLAFSRITHLLLILAHDWAFVPLHAPEETRAESLRRMARKWHLEEECHSQPELIKRLAIAKSGKIDLDQRFSMLYGEGAGFLAWICRYYGEPLKADLLRRYPEVFWQRFAAGLAGSDLQGHIPVAYHAALQEAFHQKGPLRLPPDSDPTAGLTESVRQVLCREVPELTVHIPGNAVIWEKNMGMFLGLCTHPDVPAPWWFSDPVQRNFLRHAALPEGYFAAGFVRHKRGVALAVLMQRRRRYECFIDQKQGVRYAVLRIPTDDV